MKPVKHSVIKEEIKKKRPKSAWLKLVETTYNEGKKKNPSYKYKEALKDASKKKKRGAFKKEAAMVNLKDFRKKELAKIARNKLKKGQPIKSEKREKLKKGQALDKL